MTWSYDPTEATDGDEVRGRVGDTNESDQLLSDELIAKLLDGGSVLAASIEAVKRILAKVARDVDRNAVGISTSRSQVTQHYRDILSDLRRELSSGSSGGPEPYVGGVSISEGESTRDNSDYRGTTFELGQDDHR